MIPRMGAPSLEELVEHAPGATMQPPDLAIVKVCARPSRVDACSPQDLVSQQVPNPGDLRLVEQSRLEWRTAVGRSARQCRPQLAERQAQRIGTQCIDVGVDDEPAEAPWIVEEQRPPIGKRDRSAYPPVLVGPRSVAQIINTCEAIEQ